MRTTLSLDADVAALLNAVQGARKAKFKQVVNEALRRGLEQMLETPRRRKAYRTREADLGRCLLASLDDVTEALALGEGEAFR
jgi:hypothetical protein